MLLDGLGALEELGLVGDPEPLLVAVADGVVAAEARDGDASPRVIAYAPAAPPSTSTAAPATRSLFVPSVSTGFACLPTPESVARDNSSRGSYRQVRRGLAEVQDRGPVAPTPAPGRGTMGA